MSTLRFFSTVLIIPLLFLHGCKGPKVKGLVPVRGTVTYNGEPLSGATISFSSKHYQSGDRIGTGKTDDQGRFELRTIGEVGVLPNEYVAIVVKNVVEPRESAGKSSPLGPNRGGKVKSVIPKRYNNAKTSGLEFLVDKEGLKDVRIELTD